MLVYYASIIVYIFGYSLMALIKRGLKLSGNFLFISLFVVVFGGVSASRATTVGTDTGTYGAIFTSIGSSYGSQTILSSKYPLYELYNYLLYQISPNIQIITAANAIIIAIMIGKALSKLSISFFFSSLLYVVGYYYFQSMNIGRQFIAAALIMLGTAYLLEGRVKTFWLFEFLAVLIHSTALVGVLFFIVYIIHWSKKNIILFVTISLAFFSLLPKMMPLILKIFPSYALYDNESGALSLATQSNGGQTYVYLLYLIIMVIGTLLSNNYAKFRDQKFIFLSLIMGLTIILGIVFSKQVLISRLVLYFSLFVVIYIPMVMQSISEAFLQKPQEKLLVTSILNTAIIVIMLVPMTLQLTRNISGVVPYFVFWK